jgi:predicted lipoprotein with Yx(FWY)xxD motif
MAWRTRVGGHLPGPQLGRQHPDRPRAGDAVGTITRKDRKQQVTLAGWPLYRFVGDAMPGDIAGQCKGGFFAVRPTGGKSM